MHTVQSRSGDSGGMHYPERRDAGIFITKGFRMFTHRVSITALIGVFLSCFTMSAQHGSVQGRITDAAGGAPLPGANVLLLSTTLGAAADADGGYRIDKVPAGTYALRVTFLGYTGSIRSDVVVRPGRITFVDVALDAASLETGEVEITAGFFQRRESEAVSQLAFSGEEIRRSPGSAGDVSRIMMVLPSVAKVNDQSNSLIVRGGSPLENVFYINRIEVPNINHFPAQGSSGGPLGMLPVDMISDVRFLAGGFPARSGDRLSSVMDITLRPGNTERVEGQLDVNFAGFGGLAEGPLPGENSSWLLSARRSYLDLLVNAVDVGSTMAPSYGDAQLHVQQQLSQQHRLSLFAQFSDDHNDPDAETAVENDMQYYGPQDIYTGTAGLGWRALWSGNAMSNTTLAFNGNVFRERFHNTGSRDPIYSNDSREQWLALRHATQWRPAQDLDIEAGVDVKILRAEYRNDFAAFPDAHGTMQPALCMHSDVEDEHVAGFASITAAVLPGLHATLGLRALHVTGNDETVATPRATLTWMPDDISTISASVGDYAQPLPLLLLAQAESNRALSLPRSTHYVLSFSRMLGESSMATVELYRKDGRRFPMDPAQPGLFLMDELSYRYGFFTAHGPLRAEGRTRSEGIELTLQKKLARDVYGLASASWSRSRYTDALGREFDRVYDNRVQFNIEGGYKPNERWEFSVRWLYAGGVPYTPFDIEASRRANTEVLDASRINAERHAAYHSMNVRVDRRFHFDASSIVVYISVWNVYNRKNVAGYIWDTVRQQPKTLYQWGMLPIFGVEWEF